MALTMRMPLLPIGLLIFGLFVALDPVWRVKEVFAADEGLRVRGLRSEIFIPYDQIEEVRKPWWRSGIVHVHLRQKSAFGRRIVFWAAWGFARPAIDLLRRRMKAE
jgi:hypothetical protein